MTPLPEATLNIQDVPRLFSKYWGSILVLTLLSTTLCLAVTNYIPKKYKAHFVLTIYSKYFQSPLIGDFVPGLSESSEMRSQRESLIRQILTPEYLDALGKKYGIYGGDNKTASSSSSFILRWGEVLGLYEPTSKDSQLSMDRESLRSRIEIYSMNSTTFKVGFIYSDPAVTLEVTQDIYAQVIQSLLEVRMHILGNIRNAIQSRLGSLTPAIAPVAPVTSVATDDQLIEEELTQVRNEIRSLTSQYTDEHPLVMQMRDRERILVSRLSNSSRTSDRSSRRSKSGFAAGSGEAGRDMYGDLMKKLNYLDIAIDSDRQHQDDYFAVLETPLYPSAPLWPKKGLFAVWGIALGLFGSLFIAAIREYFARSTLDAGTLARHLNLPLLGELPTFPSKATSTAGK